MEAIHEYKLNQYNEYNYNLVLDWVIDNYKPSTAQEAYDIYKRFKNDQNLGVYSAPDTLLGLVFDALSRIKRGVN